MVATHIYCRESGLFDLGLNFLTRLLSPLVNIRTGWLIWLVHPGLIDWSIHPISLAETRRETHQQLGLQNRPWKEHLKVCSRAEFGCIFKFPTYSIGKSSSVQISIDFNGHHPFFLITPCSMNNYQSVCRHDTRTFRCHPSAPQISREMEQVGLGMAPHKHVFACGGSQ